jgi:hypothetical protein
MAFRDVEAPAVSIKSANRWRLGFQANAPAAVYPYEFLSYCLSLSGYVDRRGIMRLEN